MKRTLVQFDSETHQKLRLQAFRERRSLAAVVRDLVAAGLAGEGGHSKPASIREFASVRAGRSTAGAATPVSEHHDAAIAEAFKR
jgi:plasmid stability protein